MTTDPNTDKVLLDEVRNKLEQENRSAAVRAKTWIAVRAVLIVFVIGYMSWISGAVGKLDAAELTRVAATSIEMRLPELRTELRDYAIGMAPELTDHAKDLLIEVPGQLRTTVEEQLLTQTDKLITRLETDLDTAITTVVDDHIAAVRSEFGDASAEEQLDTVILGVSGEFRSTMIEGIDELYEHATVEVQNLNTYLEHLLRDPDLSEAEQIDKELIQTWMVLVHRHGITRPDEALLERIALKF